jgi:hypothetical protein
MDPAWIAAVLSGIAAVLAALALLRSGRSDSALLGTISEIGARVDLLRSMLRTIRNASDRTPKLARADSGRRLEGRLRTGSPGSTTLPVACARR